MSIVDQVIENINEQNRVLLKLAEFVGTLVEREVKLEKTKKLFEIRSKRVSQRELLIDDKEEKAIDTLESSERVVKEMDLRKKQLEKKDKILDEKIVQVKIQTKKLTILKTKESDLEKREGLLDDRMEELNAQSKLIEKEKILLREKQKMLEIREDKVKKREIQFTKEVSR